MSATASESSGDMAPKTAPVPKRITNAQTVCNEKNEKGKLCNGHLKQLRTAGEPAEVHLRGDDVLSKCQTCGTLYMGPPLGHVRDPGKQTRFVEAELTALLQAAGGTLPAIKKNAQGVYVIVEPAAEPAPVPAKPAPSVAATSSGTTTGTAGERGPWPGSPAGVPVPPAPPAAKGAIPAAKPAAAPGATGHKPGSQPNRQLFKRSTYAGVVDTGPVAGETFAQKVERLRKVSAGAKQRAEEGGGEPSTAPPAVEVAPASVAAAEESTTSHGEAPAAAVTLAAAPVTSASPAPKTGQADRTLMRRSTYCGVADTGPVPGETFEQKVERLRKVSAAAKQRADEGDAGH